ncbi:MAG: hypothetical protein IJ632_05395 [Muribaculaceae bacterium]|nr:hypothetical protein [Muribaculaceae bacterium]
MLILMVLFYGVLLFCLLTAVYVVARILWVVVKEPVREMYFDYLDYKERREKTKYSRKRKKKQEWFEDYSKFK